MAKFCASLLATLSLAGMMTAPLRAKGSLTNAPMAVDLPTVMQLAGARNIDIRIARERLAEAKANQEGAIWQFLPTITPGVGYRRHDDLLQDVSGRILDVHKELYTVGPTLAAQLDLGESIYRNLAARQLAKAATFTLESQRQDSILAAILAYFDLAKANLLVRVAQESTRISQDYAQQLEGAVSAGIAFKGDSLRAMVQVEKNRLILRQAAEQRATAMARLVQALRLDAGLELATPTEEMVALSVVPTNTVLTALLARASAARPELTAGKHVAGAARQLRESAKVGPYIPSLGAQVFAGGLGGGNDVSASGLGRSEDYAVTLGWRIGPGGLFDRSRVRAAEARLNAAELENQKLLDEVSRETTEGFVRWQSQLDQIAIVFSAVHAAEGVFQLTRQRKQFGVGVVLEDIQAEQDLTRARFDYVTAVAELNKAQYTLLKATGDLAPVSAAR